MPNARTVALVTLGCARNEVDSEELAARLEADGFTLVEEAAEADITLVNTCGFVDAAKKDSIDTLLAAADVRDAAAADGVGGPADSTRRRARAVVAVGCLAERYGDQLAAALPEADAVLGFDQYAHIGDRLRAVLAGEKIASHTPRDRRTLLPLTPVERHAARGATREAALGALVRAPAAVAGPVAPWTAASRTAPLRRRLTGGPVAPLKLASGCDRRCAFCAIPAFRGSFVSRRPTEVLDEARWLAEAGVRELVLVSENSTSYGKDLGDVRLLEALLPELAAVPGIERVRVSYLQPAELRPGLIETIAGADGVAPYFDISFQHASSPVLRRMRRFGGTDRFLELLDRVRTAAPAAGVRSNVIVGFPGETEEDLQELERFLTAARLDVVGVFGYSDEEGTEAAGYADKVAPEDVAERVRRMTELAEELTAQRADDRIGELVEVLVESVGPDGAAEGRAAHQGPETDGMTVIDAPPPGVEPGRIISARVVRSEGVDLRAAMVEPDNPVSPDAAGRRAPGARGAAVPLARSSAAPPVPAAAEHGGNTCP